MKRRRKRKKKRTKKNKQGREKYKETTGTKLITNTKKTKIKNLEQSLEFQKYNVKGKKKETNERKRKTKSQKL